MGGVITTEEILKRIQTDADEVYVKPEENKAYWVKGEESGGENTFFITICGADGTVAE